MTEDREKSKGAPQRQKDSQTNDEMCGETLAELVARAEGKAQRREPSAKSEAPGKEVPDETQFLDPMESALKAGMDAEDAVAAAEGSFSFEDQECVDPGRHGIPEGPEPVG